MAMHPHRVVKQPLRLDPDKLAQRQQLFQTTSESEAVRQAIDETLACNEAIEAAQHIQRRGKQMHAAKDFDAKRLGERFDPFHDPYLADPYPFFAEAQAATEELSTRLPQLRLVPGQTFRFQPNTSFHGPLSLLVEWDV